MKMKTANERFSYSVWFVLDKIKDYMIPNKYEISYYFDINIRRIKPLSYKDEDRALKYLIENKVIREVREPDEAEVGKPGDKHHAAFIIYNFRINRKFFEYYDTFRAKAFYQTAKTNSRQKDFIRKQALELIKTKKIGKKQGRLLRLLSHMNPIVVSELESKTKTDNLKALVRDTRKHLENTPFRIVLVRSESIFKENFYQLKVIS